MPVTTLTRRLRPRGAWNDLHQAANDGSIMVTVALLARGSLGINQVGTLEGTTPIMIGAKDGYSFIVRILLNKGADASIVDDEEGRIALHYSVRFGHLEVCF